MDYIHDWTIQLIRVQYSLCAIALLCQKINIRHLFNDLVYLLFWFNLINSTRNISHHLLMPRKCPWMSFTSLTKTNLNSCLFLNLMFSFKLVLSIGTLLYLLLLLILLAKIKMHTVFIVDLSFNKKFQSCIVFCLLFFYLLNFSDLSVFYRR